MKFRNILLNLTVGFSALLFGLAWVGVYQFFVGDETGPATIEVSETTNFDINNPESVLPIDFEEDKLTSPNADETNEDAFDPEGYYFFDNEEKGLEDFFYITIKNKNFDTDPANENFGDLMPPRGFVILQGDEDVEYIDFETIKIADGKLQFETMNRNGISYEFDGEYLVKGNFYTLDVNEKVLQGTLVKKEDGKTVAKKDLKFNWTLEIDCLQ